MISGTCWHCLCCCRIANENDSRRRIRFALLLRVYLLCSPLPLLLMHALPSHSCFWVGLRQQGEVLHCDVFLSGCASGWYGDNCRLCGHCLNFAPCDHVTGRCPGRCATGFTGDKCDLGNPPPRFELHQMTLPCV